MAFDRCCISIRLRVNGPPFSNQNKDLFTLNSSTAKLFNLNFHPLEVVDRVISSERKIFRFDKMEVDYIQILFTDIMFYL